MVTSEKSFRTFDLQDEPDLVLQTVSSITRRNLAITDLTYTIYDTDVGRAVCIVGVERPNAQAEAALMAIPEPGPVGPMAEYPMWFRCPIVEFIVSGYDKIGFVRELALQVSQVVGRESDRIVGNIVHLQAFRLRETGRFTLTISVATTTISAQQRLVAKMQDWFGENRDLTYEVNYRNHVYDLTEDISRESA